MYVFVCCVAVGLDTAPQAKYLAASTGKDEETIMQDFSRPKYFSPFEAADYGLIDQVGVVVGQL